MIISSQHRSPDNGIYVDPVGADNQEILGDFGIRFGTATVYLTKEQLYRLMHECETAIHRSQESGDE